MNAINKKKYVIFGVEQWRPFVHIKDISQAFYLGLTAPENSISSKILKFGSSDLNFQMKSIISIFQKLIPDAIPVINDENIDLRSYRVDFSKIKSELGFQPKYEIEDGIQEIKQAIDNELLSDWETNTQYYCMKHLKKFAPQKFPDLLIGKKIYPLVNGENGKRA
jgi:nucleoside-diphosphate-sugar epimerase